MAHLSRIDARLDVHEARLDEHDRELREINLDVALLADVVMRSRARARRFAAKVRRRTPPR